MTTAPRTRAGRLLYRQLPEEHRFRDRSANDEMGDLEAYLHGFGHLLDATRGTLEQLYADAVPSGSDDGRTPQDWVLPYIAELVGARLIAPAPEARRQELERAVAWRKAKGTLGTVDEIADVVANAASVAVEGWRLTLTTPMVGTPPFTTPPRDDAEMAQPLFAARVLPGAVGTPSVSAPMRAIASDTVVEPTWTARVAARDADGKLVHARINWDIMNPHGVPCFPESYEDISRRTPDVRAAGPRRGRAHPRRVTLHVRPPDGFFEAGLKRIAAPAGGLAPESTETETLFDPARLLGTPVPDEHPFGFRIEVDGDVTVKAGGTVRIRDLLFLGTLTVEAGARVVMERAAARRLVLPAGTDEPSISAHDCLFGEIAGSDGFALLEYVTVLGDADLKRLWASDCLFAGRIPPLDCDPDAPEFSCVRFSRVPDDPVIGDCPALTAHPNTTATPVFIAAYDPVTCAIGIPGYGAPGCGVLDLVTPSAIAAGAEDGGEMGAYHHRHHHAGLAALLTKATDHAPFGLAIALRYDRRLTRRPPVANSGP
jgi:hypothetical protein